MNGDHRCEWCHTHQAITNVPALMPRLCGPCATDYWTHAVKTASIHAAFNRAMRELHAKEMGLIQGALEAMVASANATEAYVNGYTNSHHFIEQFEEERL